MKIELRGITKKFPGVTANSSVDLSVAPGEVHALLGENGAGKSTLMNVLFGLYRQTEGQILVDDEPVEFSSPADSIARGIGMVHQHFMLVPVFTVTENIMLGVEPTREAGLLDRSKARKKLLELSEEYGLKVDPDALVEDLPVGVQQRVEILKALYRDANTLILDEPTAVLTPQEIEDLFRVIHTLTESGRSVIFITHKLKEVLQIADRITVLRRGRVVGSTVPAETNEHDLATMMVGREVKLVVDKDIVEPGEPVLEVSDLVVLDDRGQPAVNGVSFDVRGREILAIAGVQGNGQTELVEAVTGLRSPLEGRVALRGIDITRAAPKKLFRMGIGHIPEDRLQDGLVVSFPIRDNLVLNTFRSRPFAKGIAVDRAKVKESAEDLIAEFDVRTPNSESAASTLSGGNQQKVIVAREFTHCDTLLIASQPTRGLDVGSIQYIHGRIVAKRDEGAAVLLVSSELDEIFALADRIAVMYQGKVASILDRKNATRSGIGCLMAGLTVDGRPQPAVVGSSGEADEAGSV